MRLWHKALIKYLPKQQLLGQWRECNLIAKNIAEKGTPNHILVNRIMDYPLDDFYSYCYYISNEMKSRNYKINTTKLHNYLFSTRPGEYFEIKPLNTIFSQWHNYHYFIQCYYNLQEKYDCGGISDVEWHIFTENIGGIT